MPILRFRPLFLPLWMGLVIGGFMPWAIAQEREIPQSLTVSQISDLSKAPSFCPRQLAPAIAKILEQSTWARSRWGVLIAGEKRSSWIYAHDAEPYFIPASNTKLLLTAAALHRLGSDFRVTTSVYAVQSQAQTSLVVSGQGDPTLTDTQLQDLARQLYARGIRHVDRLVTDDRTSQSDTLNGSWALEDVSAGSIVPITRLMVNRNAMPLNAIPQKLGEPLRLEWANPEDASNWTLVNQSRTVGRDEPEYVETQIDAQHHTLTLKASLRAGSEPETVEIPVPNPSTYVLTRFRKALEAQKISVQETTTNMGQVELDSTAIATVESPPLKALIAEINQHSDNVYGEALLRILGTQSLPNQNPDSTGSDLSLTERGLRVVRQTLTDLGVEGDTYDIVDGSGLSRKNLVSPEALVQTLQAIAQTPNAEIFWNSLAKAGESGTLKDRFVKTAAIGRVWGKTGTLEGISALSGRALNAEGQPIFFSILVNQSEQPSSAMRQAIDEIVLLLVRLRRC